MRSPSPPSYRSNRTETGRSTRPSSFTATKATRKKHAEMGFHDGWGKALDQLVALVKNKWTSI